MTSAAQQRHLDEIIIMGVEILAQHKNNPYPVFDIQDYIQNPLGHKKHSVPSHAARHYTKETLDKATQNIKAGLSKISTKEKWQVAGAVLALVISIAALQPNSAELRSADALERIAVEQSAQTMTLEQIKQVIEEIKESSNNPYPAHDVSESVTDELLLEIIAYLKNIENDNALPSNS